MPIVPVYNSPTPVGSVIINNLQSSSPYVTSFVVEIYADSALSDLIATKSCQAFWNGTVGTQVGTMTFSDLPLNNAYYLRAGTCSTHSTVTSWSNVFTANVAQISQLDSITYGGTYTATTSGVSYQVRPSGAPSNLDHYESFYTVNNATFPAGNVKPSWTGNVDSSGLLTFGAVGAPGQFIRMYVRAVDTAKNYQQWFLISTLAVLASGTFSGTLSDVPDDAAYAKTLASGLRNGTPDPRQTTGLVKLGSVNPAWSGSLYWSASTTGASAGVANFWWNQLVVKRVDGTQTVIGARNSSNPIAVTGLQSSTPSTTTVINFYPYIDDILNAVGFVNGLFGFVGSPSYAVLDGSVTEDQATTFSQLMNRQDRIGLGPIQISMPIWNGSSGGSAGGGGGYGGTCPRGDMKVRLLNGTIIRADEIKVGDKLLTTLEYGLTTRVLNVHHQAHSEWIEIQTTKGSVIVHPRTHVPVEEQADCVQAKDLTLSHILKSRKGSARITGISLVQEEHTRVILTCDKDKVFLCGKDSPDLVIHNVRLQNC